MRGYGAEALWGQTPAVGNVAGILSCTGFWWLGRGLTPKAVLGRPDHGWQMPYRLYDRPHSSRQPRPRPAASWPQPTGIQLSAVAPTPPDAETL